MNTDHSIGSLSANTSRQSDLWRSISRHVIRDFLLRTLAFHLLVTVKVYDLDQIPRSGPALVMFNHIAGIDPFAAGG